MVPLMDCEGKLLVGREAGQVEKKVSTEAAQPTLHVLADGEFAVAFRYDLHRSCLGRGRGLPPSLVSILILWIHLVSQCSR